MRRRWAIKTGDTLGNEQWRGVIDGPSTNGVWVLVEGLSGEDARRRSGDPDPVRDVLMECDRWMRAHGGPPPELAQRIDRAIRLGGE